MQSIYAKIEFTAAPDIYSEMMIDISALIFLYTNCKIWQEHLFVFLIISQERLFVKRLGTFVLTFLSLKSSSAFLIIVPSPNVFISSLNVT